DVPFVQLGADHPAEPPGFFEQQPVDVGSVSPSAFQVECGAQSGDAAADNGYPLHRDRETAPASAPRRLEAKSANAEIKVGESLSDSGRHSFSPSSVANWR